MSDETNWLCITCGCEGFNGKWPQLPQDEVEEGARAVYLVKRCTGCDDKRSAHLEGGKDG